MGLGGYLTWTATAREIYKREGNLNLKMLPCEIHGNRITRIVQSEIFEKNPLFSFREPNSKIFYLQLNNPLANYCKKDTPQKAYHQCDKHIIEQVCEYYGINKPELKCELYFSDEQRKKADKLIKKINKDFIIIEPHSKMNYTPNRAYPFEKWQNIIDEVSKHIQVVQVGQKGNEVLSGVTDFTGKTSFKEATLLIGKSKLFISAEGGLVHAATATNTNSVVVMTGYQDMRMVAYPQNVNINIANHGPCGLKILCENCQKDAENHDYKIVVDKVLESLYA